MQISNSKLLYYMKCKPTVYEASSSAFWDDEHISKYMLDAHLNPDIDSASRGMKFIKESVDWIARCCNGGQGKQLLDLGCGPGIYAELFTEKGFAVTGVDFSKRSIQYAKQHAVECEKRIQYYYQNYLDIDFENEFDVVTLIYCDFGVLSPSDREMLLKKIRKALKPEGILILDVFTKVYLNIFKEKETVHYQENGFWSDKPHVVIQRNSVYEDTKNTLEQYLVVTEGDCACYNIWNQIYSEESLLAELESGGFHTTELFGDVSGKKYTGQQETMCVIGRK